MKEVRRGVPIEGALRTRRLPVKNGEALLRNHFGSDEVQQAKQAGKVEMKKADKSLREWGNSHRCGIDNLGATFRGFTWQISATDTVKKCAIDIED